MTEQLVAIFELTSRMFKVVGAGALALGFVVATLHAISQVIRDGIKLAVAAYRKALARTILIGLEVLVAATIIDTITLGGSVRAISFLAIMVAIRTTLGWTTVLEMTGHWPWYRPKEQAAPAQSP